MTYDEEPIEVDQPIALVKCEGLEDWYSIELAKHSKTTRLVPLPDGGSVLWTSGRISDACVEGPAEHMRGIAGAIEKRGGYHEKRCAVACSSTHAEFWSPRNSMRPAVVLIEHADVLAKQIREVLG